MLDWAEERLQKAFKDPTAFTHQQLMETAAVFRNAYRRAPTPVEAGKLTEEEHQALKEFRTTAYVNESGSDWLPVLIRKTEAGKVIAAAVRRLSTPAPSSEVEAARGMAGAYYEIAQEAGDIIAVFVNTEVPDDAHWKRAEAFLARLTSLRPEAATKPCPGKRCEGMKCHGAFHSIDCGRSESATKECGKKFDAGFGGVLLPCARPSDHKGRCCSVQIMPEDERPEATPAQPCQEEP
jgi:hypothetical protein